MKGRTMQTCQGSMGKERKKSNGKVGVSMERKLYLLSPLQAEFYENESDRMYPDDVMDGHALAVYGADILQKMQEKSRSCRRRSDGILR